MKTIGFSISSKKNEKRRAILPADLNQVKNTQHIFIEEGYGHVLGIDDEEYVNAGCTICSKEEILKKDIICDPKIGDATDLDKLSAGQTIFGWIHAVQNKDITDTIVKGKLSGIAWEDMYYKGRHTFWRNNEIAGEAAVMHAFLLHGVFPYEVRVALIGKGNIARGALKILTLLGAHVTVYDRHSENLVQEELSNYDVVINALLWDVKRQDHIVYRKDLARMKKGALIIDISCDRNGAIETCIPTSFEDPTYIVDNVVHYAVDHTPTLFYKSISKSLSETIAPYLDMLITSSSNPVLDKALIIKEGAIIDPRINEFQNR